MSFYLCCVFIPDGYIYVYDHVSYYSGKPVGLCVAVLVEIVLECTFSKSPKSDLKSGSSNMGNQGKMVFLGKFSGVVGEILGNLVFGWFLVFGCGCCPIIFFWDLCV